MVSLYRLLAAAEDSLLEEPAPPLLLRTPRDCILPPALSAETVPQRLRQVLNTLPASDTLQSSDSSSLILNQSFRSPPPLPLQRILQDLGSAATAATNMSTLARILAHFGRPSEAAVASALLFLSTAVPPDATMVDTPTMFQLFALFCGDQENITLDPTVQQAVATSSHSPSEWCVDVLVKAVVTVAAQYNSPLDWRLVIHSLDVEGLETQLTRNAFIKIAKAYITGTNGNLLPADCLLDNWLHPAAQLCIISHALASSELIDWDVLEPFEGATPEDTQVPYSRVLLIEKLVELDPRGLLQTAGQQNSEIVLLSLTCVKPRTNTNMQHKLTASLLTSLLKSFPSSEKALHQMWNISPGLVEAGLISMWKKDNNTARQALKICRGIHILRDLLSSYTSFEFALDLALLAYQEGLLQFEKWLMKVLVERGYQAMTECIIFMAHKIRSDNLSIAAKLPLDGVRIMFRCLATHVRNIASHAQAQELLDSVQGVHESYVRVNPRIIDLSPSADSGDPKLLLVSESVPSLADVNGENRTNAPMSPQQQLITSEASAAAAILLRLTPTNNDGTPCGFDSTVDQEAQTFFKRLYERAITVEQAVEVLRRLQNSSLEHEKQVFNCAMYTLFDEYRFFEKYPDQELRLTGMLFGSVIQYSLLAGSLLGYAAKCVLEALKTVETTPQPLGRLVKFGLCALERFKGRVHEWPQYCSQILALPRLSEIAPELIGRVRKGFERSGGLLPSPAEQEIGLIASERNNALESTKAKLSATMESSTRNSPRSSAQLRGPTSPTASATTTPMKTRESPTDSSRASPVRTPDGSLGLSNLNLVEVLGMTKEESSQVITPDEDTQDRIKFIFNNLSHDTMDQKVSEMISILSTEYQRYFSVYIVVKRAPTEPNFHHLYLAMLERMSVTIPRIFPMVFETSYRRVRVLLSGDKGRGTSAERQVLKNLGSWIGSLTLARNKPILRRDLDLKELLLDAYSNGRLTIIVPFVAKVLDSCPRSKIFKETNPWVRGILSLMKEIHEVPDFKLNIKFELQMLCKNVLKIDLNAIVPSDLLRTRPTPDKIRNADYNTKKTLSGSPPRTSPSPSASPSPDSRRGYSAAASRVTAPVFSMMDSQPGAPANIHPVVTTAPHTSASRIDMPQSMMSAGMSHLTSESVGDLSNLLSSVSLSSANVNNAYVTRSSLHSTAPINIPSQPQSNVPSRSSNGINLSEPTIVPNLAQYITVSPTLGLFQSSPNLKRVLPYAIDRAIREIIQPVVERSCAIAFLTTKELTMKDFANEPDFNKVRRAAVQMVQQLAGSLALVTSKEPLRVSMNNQLVNILNSTVSADQAVVDQTAQVICMQNLDVGCAVIERHAKDKAARDLSEKLTPAFFARRSNQQTPQQFGFGAIPGQDVLRVYEEFARVNRLTQNQSQAPFTSAPITTVPMSYAPSANSTASAPTPLVNIPSAAQPSPHSNHTTLDERESGVNMNSISGTRGSLSDTTQNIGKAHQDQIETLNHNMVDNRQVPTSSFQVSETPISAALYGSPLPPLTPSNAVSDLILSVISTHRDETAASANSMVQSTASVSASEDEALSTQKVLERFNVVYPHLVSIISDLTSTEDTKDLSLSDIRPDHEIHTLWVQIPAAVKKSITADEAGMAVAQKVFKGLYEGDSSLYREVHVLVLEGLRESCRRLSKELVSWISFSEERKRLHKECTVALMRPASLLNKTSYDEALVKFIDNGRNINALDFACYVVRKAVLEEPLATQAEMKLTIDLMEKVGNKPNPPNLSSAPEGLLLLVDIARNTHATTPSSSTAGNNTEGHQSITQKQNRDPEPNDPDGSWEFVGSILLEWQRLLISEPSDRPMPNQAMVSLLKQLHSEVLRAEEIRERFFRILIELVVGVTFATLNSIGSSQNTPQELSSSPYTCVEVAVRLVFSLCRFHELSGQNDSSGQAMNVLCGFLTALVKNILKKSSDADFRPHFRLYSGIISELAYDTNSKDERNRTVPRIEVDFRSTNFAKRLNSISTISDALRFLDDKGTGYLQSVKNTENGRGESHFNLSNVRVLAAFTGAFSTCSPELVPSFAFCWLQLISNKELLPKFLSVSNVSGWPLFRHLLESILSFLNPFLDSETTLTRGIKTLYCGLLRVLLVLLHDFPEFLCSYHMTFCDVIPDNCVQLQNLVLASFPQDMRLPDPFSPELNVDSIPEMAYPPIILSDFTSPLEATGLRIVIDKFITENNSFLGSDVVSDIEAHLLDLDSTMENPSYDNRRTGAMVLYVGQQALRNVQSGDGHIMGGPATKFLLGLTKAIAPFGRHAILNAITNQLRYPNNNTMYYSKLMLLLFQDGDELVKEQIARVLVERLIANRPHPWGLLITFVQLIKKTEYNFWSHDFVRCTPEIEKVFKNLARFCFVPNEQQSIVVSS